MFCLDLAELSTNDHTLSVDLESPLTEEESPTETKLYLDLFTAKEVSPNVIVSFREYSFVVQSSVYEKVLRVPYLVRSNHG